MKTDMGNSIDISPPVDVSFYVIGTLLLITIKMLLIVTMIYKYPGNDPLLPSSMPHRVYTSSVIHSAMNNSPWQYRTYHCCHYKLPVPEVNSDHLGSSMYIIYTGRI
jgi:hypothetical protein